MFMAFSKKCGHVTTPARTIRYRRWSMRWTISLAMALEFAGTASAQSQPDSQGLEGIRGEIRQLRQDLRTLIGTAQPAHILVSRLQPEKSVITTLHNPIHN